MNRRTFNKLAGISALGTMASSAGLYAQENGSTGAGEGEIVLEDNELLVAFDKASGALTRMVRKSSAPHRLKRFPRSEWRLFGKIR